VSRPGPAAQPAWRLKCAAIDYAAALEAGEQGRAQWDQLRKAALAHQEGPRPEGRPRKFSTAGPHRGAAAGAGGSLPGPAAVPAMEREG
jgi:hypothetical protein